MASARVTPKLLLENRRPAWFNVRVAVELEEALKEAERGGEAPLYLLWGEEFLVRAGADERANRVRAARLATATAAPAAAVAAAA